MSGTELEFASPVLRKSATEPTRGRAPMCGEFWTSATSAEEFAYLCRGVLDICPDPEELKNSHRSSPSREDVTTHRGVPQCFLNRRGTCCEWALRPESAMGLQRVSTGPSKTPGLPPNHRQNPLLHPGRHRLY